MHIDTCMYNINIYNLQNPYNIYKININMEKYVIVIIIIIIYYFI